LNWKHLTFNTASCSFYKICLKLLTGWLSLGISILLHICNLDWMRVQFSVPSPVLLISLSTSIDDISRSFCRILIFPWWCYSFRYLATASSDHTVKIWNVDGFTLEKTLIGNSWSLVIIKCFLTFPKTSFLLSEVVCAHQVINAGCGTVFSLLMVPILLQVLSNFSIVF